MQGIPMQAIVAPQDWPEETIRAMLDGGMTAAMALVARRPTD
ncbi:MAG: hypothetical protein ABWZ75_09880 [Novosphingobium sp.]